MTTVVRTRTDTVVRNASAMRATLVRSSGAVTPTIVRVVGVAQAGPPGPPGSATSASYVHIQTSPSSVWTVQHQLGFKPQPTVLASNGDPVYGWTPSWPSDNTMLLTFPVAVTGSAHVS
jgi:hypothetical protein